MGKLTRRLGAAIVAGVGLAAMVPAVSAVADSGGTLLPISGFQQLVADSVNSHLFFSQGGNGGIVVTDLSGNDVTTIANTTGANGMALSADGGTLYAALDTSGEVVAISTGSLQITATYSLPSGDQPVYVAVQSGLVWISYNDGSTAPSGAIGDVDPSATTPAFAAEPSMGTWYSAPELASDPSNSGVLVAGQPDNSAGQVATFDTAGSSVTTLAPAAAPLNCGFVNSIAVTAGGADVIVACSGDSAEVYTTASLSPAGSYLADGGPDGTGTNAVAIDASGDVAVGTATISGTGTDLSGPDLYTYPAGSTTAANALTLNSAFNGSVLKAGSVAWVGSAVYGVIEYNTGMALQYYLQVIDQPLVTQSSLTLSAPSSVNLGTSVSVTGTLTFSTGAPPAGTAVTITRTEQGSTGTKIFPVTTGTGGTFSLADTPPSAGTFTYTASYVGSQSVAAATAAQTVTVKKLVPALTLSTGHTTFSYNAVIKVTAHLGKTFSVRAVAIYAHDLSGSKTVLLRKANVNSKGDLTVSYRAPHSTTFIVKFAGDAKYAARSVSRTVRVRASVTQHVTGNYGTEHRGGHLYYLFAPNKTLYSKVTVRPNQRGQCVKFQLEAFQQGTWISATSPCGRLSTASTLLLKLSLQGAPSGVPFRIRAEFLPAKTDHANLAADSFWAYFLVK